jgi:hypothetical protein
MGEKHGRWILLTKHLFYARRVLLHAVNLRHGTDGFTSPPKEVVRRIFITLKNPSSSAGFKPANLGSTTRPPRATTCKCKDKNMENYLPVVVLTPSIVRVEDYTEDVDGTFLRNNEDGCLLGCSAVQSGRSLPTFQRSLLPPSSWMTTRRYNPEDSHLSTHHRENLRSYFLRNVCKHLQDNPHFHHCENSKSHVTILGSGWLRTKCWWKYLNVTEK